MSFDLKSLSAIVAFAGLAAASGHALAGQTIMVSGTMSCVVDTWKETEREKGHKLVDSTIRCILIPDDAAAPKVTEQCKGNYEYRPDGSWKGSGTCTDTYHPGGDTITNAWEESSSLKEYPYKNTGGTGKYTGAGGGGTYNLQQLTDVLYGGRYKGTIDLP